MYACNNFKTKKSIKEAIIKNGNAGGIFQPGPFRLHSLENGIVGLEGPHFPAAHTWWAQATIENGKIVKIT